MKLECGQSYSIIETSDNQNCGFFPDFFSANAPRISPTSNASVMWGSPTWLKCNTIYPDILTTPMTFWLFNNTRLAKESQHYHTRDDGPRMGPNSTKLLSLQLHISNVSAQDVGWYTCGVDFKIYVVTADVYFSLKEETPGGNIVYKEKCSFCRYSFSPTPIDIMEGRDHSLKFDQEYFYSPPSLDGMLVHRRVTPQH